MTAERRRTLIDECRMFGRFVRGLKGFLGHPLLLEGCSSVLGRARETRQDAFLRLMRKGVFDNAKSPYRKLLQWAGVGFPDLSDMVRKNGLEETLGHLFDAGVYVGIDEFKGRVPIRRGSWRLDVSASDFDNPLPAGHFEGSTGGSRGAGRRLIVDLDLVAHDTAAHGLFLQAFGISGLPLSLWRPVAPGASGTKKVLMHAKLRLPMGRWFSQNHPGFLSNPKSSIFTGSLVQASHWWGGSIPSPEYQSLGNAASVAQWLSRQSSVGTHFDTNVSSGVRICLAALEAGLSLEGVFFRVGGEPLTEAKVERFRELGARVVCHYSLSEVGPVGMACANPVARDDVHFRSDKMGLILRPGPAPLERLAAFHLTTLLPSCPKIMINVATGDYGTLERRNCGCAWNRPGLDLHLRDIRSYEKLTTAGMQFLGLDLIRLLDDELPSALGGGPTDYQLVEEERSDGRTVLRLVVSPRVGAIDEVDCLETVYRFLRDRAPENRMMVDRLREESVLKVVREEPHATLGSKVLPLHLVRRLPS